jgi:uncharacterized membrane protein
MATQWRKCTCCRKWLGVNVSIQVLSCRDGHHGFSVLTSPAASAQDMGLPLSCLMCVSMRRGLVLARRGLVLARVRSRAGSSSRGFVLALSKNDLQEEAQPSAAAATEAAAAGAAADEPAAAEAAAAEQPAADPAAAEAAAAEAAAAEAAAAGTTAAPVAPTGAAPETQAAKRRKVAELFVFPFFSPVFFLFLHVCFLY